MDQTICDNLESIRLIAEPLLKKCVISDIVFRPFDMGGFGPGGYSLVLANVENKKMLGVRFGYNFPLNTTIEFKVMDIVNRINGSDDL